MWLIATYDRWLEELVAAGRLPGDIAEEMNGGLNTGGCVPVKTHSLAAGDFAHEPWRAPFC